VFVVDTIDWHAPDSFVQRYRDEWGLTLGSEGKRPHPRERSSTFLPIETFVEPQSKEATENPKAKVRLVDFAIGLPQLSMSLGEYVQKHAKEETTSVLRWSF
jgi:hypothetical protein